MSKSEFTNEQLLEIIRLRDEAGWSYAKIAEKYGKLRQSMKWTYYFAVEKFNIKGQREEERAIIKGSLVEIAEKKLTRMLQRAGVAKDLEKMARVYKMLCEKQGTKGTGAQKDEDLSQYTDKQLKDLAEGKS